MSFSYHQHPKFTFKPGSRVKGGVDAQTIGEALSQIEKEEGGVTPESVVDAARPEDAPMHPCFTWDDSVAAEEYRKSEARNLVRVIQVEVQEREPAVTAFVNVQMVDPGANTGSTAYVSGEKVAKDVGMFDHAWRAAKGRVDSAQRSLEELERMVSAYGGEAHKDQADLVRQAIDSVKAASEVLSND